MNVVKTFFITKVVLMGNSDGDVVRKECGNTSGFCNATEAVS